MDKNVDLFVTDYDKSQRNENSIHNTYQLLKNIELEINFPPIPSNFE